MPSAINNDRCFEIASPGPLPECLRDGQGQKVRFYASGREALIALCRSFNVSDAPAVFLPAFVPEGVYAPFKVSGWRIVLYQVDRELDPAWDHLEGLLRHCPPLVAVLIHYFGLPKPVERFRRLCHRHGTWVVEDMAHAYLGETENGPLGRTGDVVLYSFPKMMGVPDGAALVVRRELPGGRLPRGRESFLHRVYVIQRLLELAGASIVNRLANRWGRVAGRAVGRLIPFSSYAVLMRYFRNPAPMSRPSCVLLRRVDHERLRHQRRTLARLYARNLDRSRFDVFAGADASGNVMMGFPVRVKDRASLIRHLAAHCIAGVSFTDRWHFIPPHDEAAFRDALDVMQSHFLFPLHQRLSERQVERVIEVANHWKDQDHG